MDIPEEFTVVEFCAGYLGIHLGLQRVIPNLRLIAACEIEAFVVANLVAKMEAGLMDPAPIWTNLKTFPCSRFRDKVDLLVAGYPCQPFSHAGQRKGHEDPRHLWPHIRRAERIIRPRSILLENVEGHISLGLREVLGDLEADGYRTAWGIFSAAEVGAPHRRKRVFILAHSKQSRLEGYTGDVNEAPRQKGRGTDRSVTEGSLQREELAHSPRFGRRGRDYGNEKRMFGALQTTGPCGECWPSRPGEPQYAWEPPRVVDDTLCGRHIPQKGKMQAGGNVAFDTNKGETQSEVGRSPDGPPGGMDYAKLCVSCDNRTDELRLLGNGVVPAVAAKAWVTLMAELENG